MQNHVLTKDTQFNKYPDVPNRMHVGHMYVHNISLKFIRMNPLGQSFFLIICRSMSIRMFWDDEASKIFDRSWMESIKKSTNALKNVNLMAHQQMLNQFSKNIQKKSSKFAKDIKQEVNHVGDIVIEKPHFCHLFPSNFITASFRSYVDVPFLCLNKS